VSDFALTLGPGGDIARPGFARWTRSPAGAGEWQVAADATLFHRRDLLRAVSADAAGVEETSEALIARAFAARGAAAVPALEGDFAFVAWNRPRAELSAARDFGGKRALFYSWHGDTLRIATRISAILADGVPRDLDLVTVGSVGAGLWSHASATGYAHIHELPAGHALEWRPGTAPVVRPHWQPPLDMPTRRRPLADAAEELRALLAAAVRERMAPGATAVSLSGGWDSTAVYASAQALARGERGLGPVQSVSISYPEGDPGREDELIASVTQHWGSTPDFTAVDTIPLSVEWEREAAAREQPFAHAYEHWNRALARRARALGASVLLDGVGGDQLFQASDIFLADLVRTFQWGEVWRQYRAPRSERRSLRDVYRWGVRPNLPRALQRAIAGVRRMPMPPDYLDRTPANWFRRDFLLGRGVMERERMARPALPTRPFLLAEAHAYLRFPFYPRIFSHLHRFAREEGVELRSPLLDGRVVAFALRRPWSDRVDGAETKLLLRRAMADLLPAAVLAPRPHRTGTTNAYFLRELRRTGWPVAQQLFPDLRLASLGLVEPRILQRAWEFLLQHDDDELAVRLWFTLQAELWLRTRVP
jgi:asparagine synthase (glutamine-hydrolysing)